MLELHGLSCVLPSALISAAQHTNTREGAMLKAESRSLNVRLGYKTKEAKAGFVHMLNGTLCATERAICCLVENYQTPDVSRPIESFIRQDGFGLYRWADKQGLRIPKVLQPYMQGRDFLPYTAPLPVNSTTSKKK